MATATPATDQEPITNAGRPFNASDECAEGEWKNFIEAMHSGRVVEITEENYWYWLEVLPPVFMRREIMLGDGSWKYADFGFAEGAEPITIFWRKDGRFFCQRTDQMNPHA